MSFTKKTIRDIDLKDKTVIIRVDFNVPLNEHGVITDDYRIRQALPTVEHVRSMGAKVVLISHLGRPEGKQIEYSLSPVATKLQDLLHLPVTFVDDCIGEKVKQVVSELKPGDIVLLENVRFYKQETDNDEAFAKQLSEYGDVFVQDGFGVVHRAHATTEGITHFLPSVAGFLLEREVSSITKATQNPERPLGVVVGGAKISDKIDLLNKFIEIADFVAVVGAMANTFLLAEGVNVGKSLVEKEAIDSAKEVLAKAKARMKSENFTFYLPQDVVVSESLDGTKSTRVVDISHHTWADIGAYPKTPERASYTTGESELILDIGPISAAHIAGALQTCKTAIWNGTAGVTETKGINGAANPFEHGTKIISESLVGLHAGDKNHPFTVVGGGDTVGYIESKPGLRERLGHVSTGGGASLELMAGYSLPGVEALVDKESAN
jgi:3-phosphoglycerate kinase